MIQKIGVHIKVENFEVSRKFYEALGFTKIFEYGPEKGFDKDASGNLISATEAYHGMTFEHGGCKLEIADGHRAVKPEVFASRMTNSKVSLMIPVDSVEEILKVCEANNFPIGVPVRHYYWRTLELVVKDPDGVVLVFIQPYDEETAKRLNADETFGKPSSS